MLSSITPLGERARRRRWGVTVAFYVSGSLLGGATAGVLAGAAGQLASPFVQAGRTVVVLAALLAGVALALDARLGGLRSPTVHRQVNESWLARYRSWVYGLGFGAQLGFGVVTVVSSASVYLMLALAFLTGSAAAGALVGSTYGVVRALPIVATARATTMARLNHLHRTVAAWEGPVHRVTLATETVACLAAVALIVTGP